MAMTTLTVAASLAILALLAGVFGGAPHSAAAADVNEDDGVGESEVGRGKGGFPRCRLYLAPTSSSSASSTPLPTSYVDPTGRTGVYTAVPLPRNNASVPLSLPDVVLNLPDLELNWRLRMTKERGVQWDHYSSDPSTFIHGPARPPDGIGPALERHGRPSPSLYGARYDAENITSIVPGLASLARRATRGSGSGNVVRGTRPHVDGAGLHRARDAGAGGFTAYHGHDHVVVESSSSLSSKGEDTEAEEDDDDVIPAGSEIFVEAFHGAFAASSPDEELKSVEWLEEHGLCLDNLRPGPSLVDQAGRGAFAVRPLSTGQVVAPVPVIPLRRQALGRYYRDHDDGPIQHMGDMLVRNYCYGAEGSSVMLLPLGPLVNLINGAPEGTEPNVALRWSSSDDDGSSSAWLERSAEEVLAWSPDDSDALPFPSMELIALRPISPDEELYLDYGPSWSSSWSSHLTSFSNRGPLLHADKYVPPELLNADPNSPLPAGEELIEDDPPPDNVMMTCRVSDDIGQRVAFDGRYGAPERTWYDVAETRGDNTFWTSDAQVRQCTTLGRDKLEDGEKEAREGERTYTVIADFSTYDVEGERYAVRNVPRKAIEFVDRYYAKDQYLAGAFRHEIALPEGVFPDAWMDIRQKEEARRAPGGDACGMYVAPSSIPHSGLGMYTAKEIPLGTTIHPTEVVVQEFEHDGNNEFRQRYHRIRPGSEKDWLLFTYYWESRVSRGNFECDDRGDTITMIPGLGMLANSHTGLVNAMHRKPDVDSGGLHRSKDPGVGAFSEYHNYRYEATSLHPDRSKHRPIPAGMELFVEYGDDWFADREWLFGPIPLSHDFINADRILDRFVDLTEAIGADGAFEDLWEITKNFVDWSARMDRAMPSKLEDVRRVRAEGTAMASVPDVVRSIEWLEENGRCLDNVREGPSTINQAGRGAFATRFLPKGAVIAPAPATHIHRKHLEIYELDGDDDIYFDETHQLLLNYCYGHPRSSLLLFPYSPVVNLINHCPDRKPNAAVRWSDMDTHRTDWYGRSVNRLMEEKYAGLVMEFVALRDIEEGEEVLIDYGRRWSDAWDDHVRNWEPAEDDAEEYVSASMLNELGGPLRTEEEQEFDPYPPNVQTICYVPKSITTSDDRGPHEWFSEVRVGDYHDYGMECTLLSRYDSDNAYSDSARPTGDYYRARVSHFEYDNRHVIVEGIPRSAVELVDRPYTSNQHLGNAFRHELHVPDGMFPEAWMDLGEEEEAEEKEEEEEEYYGDEIVDFDDDDDGDDGDDDGDREEL